MKVKRASKYVVKEERQSIQLLPKTEKQAEYIRALRTAGQVVVTGSAGTGKTFIASVHAAKMLREGAIDKIVLTRPNVSSGKSLGFFPGSLEEKIAPWVIPFTDVLRQCLGDGAYATAIAKRNIDIVPFEVMRGRTFNRSVIILDEAQNTTPSEMKMFLTRVGEESQVIINGDIKQSDLKTDSGLRVILNMIRTQNLPIPSIEFTVDDIVRSDICAMWVKAFDKVGL